MGAQRHPRRLLALLAPLVLAVGACTDRDAAAPTATAGVTTDAPTPSESSASPFAPTPTPTPPALPPEATQGTLDGAVAFTRHYFDTLNYAFATGDVEAEAQLRAAECVACESARRDTVAAYEAGGRLEGAGVTITEVVPTPGDIDLGVELRVVAASQSGRALNARGEVVKEYSAGEPFLVLVFVTWDGAAWTMAEWGNA